MELNNKFEIGEDVYFLSKENIKETCDVCLGRRTVILKLDSGEREMECFKCYGVGYSISHHKRYVIDEEVYKVSSIKANISKDKITLKYCLTSSSGKKISRSENNISKYLDELNKRCEHLNYIDEIPEYLNYNKKSLKELVDVYICGGRVLKNTFKYMHETTDDDIKNYIDTNKVVCVENNDTCTLYTSDFSRIKNFAEVLKMHFPEKKFKLGSDKFFNVTFKELK